MKFVSTAALLALATSAAAQDQPWSYPELLRHFHVAAYSTGICPASDEIALYTFNATGRHPSRPATDMSVLTYSIIGFVDGQVVAAAADQNRVLTDDFPAGQETIRCVQSAAREQGATHFVVRIMDIRIHQTE